MVLKIVMNVTKLSCIFFRGAARKEVYCWLVDEFFIYCGAVFFYHICSLGR